MEDFQFNLEQTIAYKNELFIIIGRAHYLNGQKLYFIQSVDKYFKKGLDFTVCFWAHEDEISLPDEKD